MSSIKATFPVEANRSQETDATQGGFLSRERMLALVLVVLTALVFGLCVLLIRPFLPALAWALALAVVASPIHSWIAARVKNADLAAGLAVAWVVVLLVMPAAFVVQRISVEAGEGISSVQEQAQNWKERLADQPRLLEAVNWVEANIDMQGEIPRAVNSVFGELMPLLSGSVWAVTQLLLTLFCLYYFFRDRHKVLAWIRSLLPLNQDESTQLLKRVKDTVYATVYGTLVVAAIQGTLGGLMFWWLGVPAPLTWGVIMGLLAVIPYLGAFVIWAPVALGLALQGHWDKALWLTAWGVIVVGFIDNLIYPILVGNKLRMHSLLALFAILGGLALFGGSGLILGPVLVSMATVLVEVWRNRLAHGKTAEQGVHDEPPQWFAPPRHEESVGKALSF